MYPFFSNLNFCKSYWLCVSLAILCKKFPGGLPDRWQRIATELNRSEKDVVAQAMKMKQAWSMAYVWACYSFVQFKCALGFSFMKIYSSFFTSAFKTYWVRRASTFRRHRALRIKKNLRFLGYSPELDFFECHLFHDDFLFCAWFKKSLECCSVTEF